MFENTTYFDLDDDDLLGTSFTSASTSTQRTSTEKRNSEEMIKENYKKPKLYNNDQNSLNKLFSEQGKLSNDSFNSPSRVVKRKFPGPAGLLPERTEGNKSILELASEKLQDANDSRDMILCSQQTVSDFADGPWKEMTKDFCVYDGGYLYEKFNINWIKREASLKKLLVNYKAPFLASVIQSVEIFDGKIPTVIIILKDLTGEIQGTILHSLYEEYSNFLTVGSVIVLKQFGVLSAGYNNHCLTITHNNLLTIYCLQTPSKQQSNTDNFNHGLVKKVVVQEYSVNEILSKYKEDVLANSMQRQRCNELGQSNQSFFRNNLKLQSSNISMISRVSHRNSQESCLDISKFKNNFNRTRSDDSNSSTWLDNRVKSGTVVNNENFVKYIYKQPSSEEPANTSSDASHDLVKNTPTNNQQKIRAHSNCDNIELSHCQISIKPDTTEHAEIWKNLLQDVDTNSLFDDF